MSSQFLKGTGVVPEPASLSMRGIQTDAFGEVKGGHKAIFDPVQSGMTGILSAGDAVPNLITGNESFNCTQGNFLGAAIEIAKGIEFANTSTSGEGIALPEHFDFLTLGDQPSIVLSAWITNKTAIGSAYPSIMGHAYQTGTYSQWSICHANTENLLALRCQNAKAEFTVELNTPVLLTLYAEKTADGVFQVSFYLNDQLKQVSPGQSYPFKDPSASGAESLNIGGVNGFAYTWNGIVHRINLLKVDEDVFDIDEWLAAEIANNASRFVTA